MSNWVVVKRETREQMNIDFLLVIGMTIGFWSFVTFVYRWWF